ncbi:endonuclease/exonuclease/phosphatase family protein [Marivirga lumbricoides]
MTTKINLIIILSFLCINLNAQTVKVMSYNVQQPNGTNWEGRKGSVASIINSNQPDVIGSQEALAYMAGYIKGTEYTVYGRGRDCDEGGEGSFIFYKSAKYDIDYSNSGSFWFKDNSSECGRGWDPDYNRICTYVRLIEKSSGKGFYIFNSHFATSNRVEARSKSAKLLVNRVNERTIKDPVILTGDFNSIESDPITSFFKTGSDNPVKLRDTYRDVHPSSGGNTFGSVKYDYIYVPASSNIQTLASEVIESPVGSDHRPIWAELDLNAGDNPSTWRITIQGSNGKYLSSEDGLSAMMCDRDEADDWEKFDVIDNPDGTFSLRGSNGKYVSSENGNSPMMCDRNTPDDWEKFNWVELGGNAFAIKGSNGNYVSSENGLSGVMCNRPDIGEWETFNWTTVASGASTSRVQEVVSEEGVINGDLALFPNPANTYFKISGLGGTCVRADIYDLYGELVNKSCVSAGEKIEISSLTEGTYLVKLSTENGATQTFRLIKK